MERFLQQHRDRVIGVLSGLDRIVFRGSLRSISYVSGLEAFLSSQQVLHRDFGGFAQGLSDQIKQHAHALADGSGRPLRYLASGV